MFVQRTIVSLLLPYAYRYFTLNRAVSVFNTIKPVLAAMPFITMIKHFLYLIILNVTGRSNPVLTNSRLLGAIGNPNLVPEYLRSRILIASLFLGLIGRLGMYLTWAMAFPIVAATLYVITKQLNYTTYYLELVWYNLPMMVKDYFICVQHQVHDVLSQMIAVTEPKKTVTWTMMIISTLKTITYYGGWGYIGTFFEFLDTFWIFHNLYDNWVVAGAVQWVLANHYFGLFMVYCIWRPLNWLMGSPIMEIIRWIFVRQDFFIIEWIKAGIRYLRRNL